MARGDSGRIVIEVDPDLKDQLYVELARRRLTLKAWFVEAAEQFMQENSQPSLFVAERPQLPYFPAARPPKSRKKS